MNLHKENKNQAIKFIKKYDRLNQLRRQFAENEEKETGPGEVNLLQKFYQNNSPIEYALIREANHYCGNASRSGNYDYTPLTRKPCRQLFEGPYLLANGKYTICREDINATQTIGDTTDNIETLWRSETMDEIFRIHHNENWQSHPLCQNCKDWYHSYV